MMNLIIQIKNKKISINLKANKEYPVRILIQYTKIQILTQKKLNQVKNNPNQIKKI